MSVLNKADLTDLKCKPSDVKLMPEGATAAEAKLTSQGWCVAFETPDGEILATVGDMGRAVRLAMRLTGYIRKEARKA